MMAIHWFTEIRITAHRDTVLSVRMPGMLTWSSADDSKKTARERHSHLMTALMTLPKFPKEDDKSKPSSTTFASFAV